MRRALWIFSAPVVAGGLAWAINSADNNSTLQAGTPQSQNGRIMYFSRSGKPVSSPSASDSADSGSSDDDDSVPPPSPQQRSLKSRTTATTTTAQAPLKNYKSLFADPETTIDSSAPQQTSSRRLSKPTTTASKPNKRAVTEECGVTETADADAAREEVPLPPVGKTQQVSGVRDSAGVKHADLKVRDGAGKSGIQPAQYKGAAKSPNLTIDEDDDPDFDFDVPAKPKVPAPAKPAARTAKETPAKAFRPSVEVKTTPTRPAARKPQTAGVSKVPSGITQVSASEATADATFAPAGGAQGSITSTATADVPLVSLRWTKISEVNVGQECKCGLVVKNTGKLAAKDIVVEAYFPKHVRLIDAEPFPNDSKDHLVWIFEHLEPGQEKAVEITMIPSRRGELETSATVRFTGVAKSVLTVEEPQLTLSISGSHEVMVGETLTQIIVVSNPGTGIAHDVVVHAKLPQGLEHPRGKIVEMGIGSLGPGESRELRLPLVGSAGGDVVVLVEARGSGNLAQSAQSSIRIAAPKLGVAVTGPGLRYVGRNAQYLVTVTNEGVAATDNVRITHLIPEGFEFIKADKGGKLDASTGSVIWFVGRLDAGESMQVAVDMTAKQIGEGIHHVQASGENGVLTTAKVATRVDGSSKVVMELADIDDPVEVGTQTAYEIRIRNDGSKAAQNLKISCELPQGLELIDTSGPTENFIDKGVLYFKPLAELAAGSKATYVIRVNGKVAGNLRLRARLTSNASPEPVVVEEMTKFYAD
jgi:uncharacterized repeat protein (TIGR01451 family)